VANPTTNYGFVLPTPTDLVTDLPADFDVALQGVDTRLKALQPGTTLGDLAYSSATANTNTRLAVGSTGNVLTVAGGVPTWAAPAVSASGLTLITAQTFTTSSNINVNSCFSATYQNYLIQIIVSNTSAASDAFLRLRASGTDASGNDYKWASLFNHSVTSTPNGASSNSASAFSDYFIGYDSGGKVAMTATMFRPFEATSTFITSQSVSSPLNSSSYNYARTGVHSLTNSYDGFSLTVNSGTITGNLRVFGLANS